MAKERGIDTYLVNWNIFVSPALSKAYGVATDNLAHNIHAKGDTSALVKRYTRECVTQVLEEYPDLTGLGFTHGEGMGGMTPQAAPGLVRRNDPRRHAPGKPQGQAHSPGAAVGQPGHGRLYQRGNRKDHRAGQWRPSTSPRGRSGRRSSSTGRTPFRPRGSVKVHGGKLSNTYFEPAAQKLQDRLDGPQRGFSSACAGACRASCGNTSRPIRGRTWAATSWAPNATFPPRTTLPPRRGGALAVRVRAAVAVLQAVGPAALRPAHARRDFPRRVSRAATGRGPGRCWRPTPWPAPTPLRLASSFDFSWDFTLYSEGFMALQRGRMAYISVDRQIEQPPATRRTYRWPST
jgi:hypothetical protein